MLSPEIARRKAALDKTDFGRTLARLRARNKAAETAYRQREREATAFAPHDEPGWCSTLPPGKLAYEALHRKHVTRIEAMKAFHQYKEGLGCIRELMDGNEECRVIKELEMQACTPRDPACFQGLVRKGEEEAAACIPRMAALQKRALARGPDSAERLAREMETVAAVRRAFGVE